MLPPSDSFLHHTLKVNEVNLQSQQDTMMSPPPPYTIQTPPTEALQSDLETDLDDGAAWDTPTTTASSVNPNLITIHINASISVQGNNNTIIMASGSIPQPQPQPQLQTQTDQSAPSSSSSSPTSSSMNTSARTNTFPTTSTPSPAAETAASALQTAPKHRQAKLTEMATSIIAALHEQQRDPGSGVMKPPPPIETNINTGLKIEGSQNVICAGGRGERGVPVVRRRRDGGLQHNTGNGNGNDGSSGSRKRRAQSEPVDIPRSKKECLVSSSAN